MLLDATEAFDRVKYYKMFDLLIDCKLPPIMLRFLLLIYQGLIFRNGIFSNMIAVINAVEQV